MEKPLRVLIVEDSEKDAELFIHQLKQGGYTATWERVDDLETLNVALNKGPWDIIISDHSMPQFSAIKALELLKERDLDIPVIILSGTIDEESAIAAMRSGASDYIMKGNTARLLPAIERELREAQDRRARRMAEEQFRQAQKMEPIGRLAGGVAHDFNNLLTAILGLADLSIKELPENHKMRKDLEEIRETAKRAAQLTQQLLAFSRKQIVQPQPLDINGLITNSSKMLRRLIAEDIKLEIITAPDIWTVKADPGKIEQMIVNLCVNARDAMLQGGHLVIKTTNVTVDEEAARTNRGLVSGQYTQISVVDSGVGMTEEVKSHLFEPFFTTKEQGKGTGLGLATCYGIVKQSGGYIAVESELGRGTTFKVYLPRIKAKAAPIPKLPRAKGIPRGSETILVVEDESSVRNLAVRLLRNQGYTVREAPDGQEALEILKRDSQGKIRLVITDVVMPKLGGKSIADELRSQRPDMKIIFTSGYTDEIITEHGVLEPGINFVSKPFTLEILACKVREVIDSR